MQPGSTSTGEDYANSLVLTLAIVGSTATRTFDDMFIATRTILHHQTWILQVFRLDFVLAITTAWYLVEIDHQRKEETTYKITWLEGWRAHQAMHLSFMRCHFTFQSRNSLAWKLSQIRKRQRLTFSFLRQSQQGMKAECKSNALFLFLDQVHSYLYSTSNYGKITSAWQHLP